MAQKIQTAQPLINPRQPMARAGVGRQQQQAMPKTAAQQAKMQSTGKKLQPVGKKAKKKNPWWAWVLIGVLVLVIIGLGIYYWLM